MWPEGGGKTARLDPCFLKLAPERQAKTSRRRFGPILSLCATRSDGTMADPKRFAMVCAANMNRSMEAHKVALNAGLDVKSYGAGNRVKLPGASRDNPNVFEFGSATYKDIYDKLMVRGLFSKGALSSARRTTSSTPATTSTASAPRRARAAASTAATTSSRAKAPSAWRASTTTVRASPRNPAV